MVRTQQRHPRPSSFDHWTRSRSRHGNIRSGANFSRIGNGTNRREEKRRRTLCFAASGTPQKPSLLFPLLYLGESALSLGILMLEALRLSPELPHSHLELPGLFAASLLHLHHPLVQPAYLLTRHEHDRTEQITAQPIKSDQDKAWAEKGLTRFWSERRENQESFRVATTQLVLLLWTQTISPSVSFITPLLLSA